MTHEPIPENAVRTLGGLLSGPVVRRGRYVPRALGVEKTWPHYLEHPMEYMEIKKFVEEGYLQEVNRRFFHPLGLALVVMADTGEPWRIEGVWDAQDDPEGINFGAGSLDPSKAAHIKSLEESRRPAREDGLGYWVQPLDE